MLGVPYAGGYYGAPFGVAGVLPRATYYSSGYYGLYPGVTSYSYGVAPVGVAPVAPVGVYGYRAFAPRYYGGYYGGFGRFGYPGFRRRAWGYW
jgi:hypothetical protein